jgi:hypothetical protein
MPYPRSKPPAGGTKANYPGFIEPALATSIGKVPSGERWVHEIKFDGYRVQVHLRDAAVTVFTDDVGRCSPLGPLGIIFLRVLCGPVFGFRREFVEVGLISVCLVS